MVVLPYLGSILALPIFFFFLFFYLLKTNNGLPRNYPLVGMAPMILVSYNHLSDAVYDILNRSGGTFFNKGMWFTNTDILFTSDPKNIHYITSTNFSNYLKGPESKEIFDTLGISLFNEDFEDWSFYRKIFLDYFKRPQFHKFLNKVVLENVNKGLIPVLQHVAEQGMVVDMCDVFKRYFLDSSWLFSTGYKLGTLSIDFPENPFGKAMDDACQAMFYRSLCLPIIWKLQKLLGLGSEKKLHAAKKIVQEIVHNYILKRKEEVFIKKLVGEDNYNYLKYMLLNPLEAGEEPYPEQNVKDNILGLIFAAYDTSSTTLSWLFWLLSKNPEIEAKIRQEIIDTCVPVSQGRKWKLENKEELSNLVYLHSAICEALRLYPPAPFSLRFPVEVDVLPSGHLVAPKTRIIMSRYSVGRMKSLWGEDSLEFRPERWIDRHGNFKYESSSKFFTFHAGPRICPGKDIAFTFMKAAAATIIYNFHIEVVETAPPIPKASIILAMKHGMKAKVKTLV